jgi:hypothetical protein
MPSSVSAGWAIVCPLRHRTTKANPHGFAAVSAILPMVARRK